HLLSAPSALRTCGPTQQRPRWESHRRDALPRAFRQISVSQRASLVKTLRTEVRFGMLSPEAAGAGLDYTARFRGRTAIASDPSPPGSDVPVIRPRCAVRSLATSCRTKLTFTRDREVRPYGERAMAFTLYQRPSPRNAFFCHVSDADAAAAEFFDAGNPMSEIKLPQDAARPSGGASSYTSFLYRRLPHIVVL